MLGFSAFVLVVVFLFLVIGWGVRCFVGFLLFVLMVLCCHFMMFLWVSSVFWWYLVRSLFFDVCAFFLLIGFGGIVLGGLFFRGFGVVSCVFFGFGFCWCWLLGCGVFFGVFVSVCCFCFGSCFW